MNSGRRIAAAVLAAALSMGAIGLSAGPAEAKDTSWPGRIAPPSGADTSWPSVRDTSPLSLSDTSWPE